MHVLSQCALSKYSSPTILGGIKPVPFDSAGFRDPKYVFRMPDFVVLWKMIEFLDGGYDSDHIRDSDQLGLAPNLLVRTPQITKKWVSL